MHSFEHGAKFVFQTSLKCTDIKVRHKLCLFVGGGPIHHLRIPGGVVPTRDKVEVVLMVLHAYKIYGREALAAYEHGCR